ncbi:MAG: hypothetical protein ABMB14_08840 [Myxococcota bacterium]
MLAFLALLATARADVAPARPLWDDPEAPLPEPPEDLELALVIVALAAPLLASRALPRAAAS